MLQEDICSIYFNENIDEDKQLFIRRLCHKSVHVHNSNKKRIEKFSPRNRDSVSVINEEEFLLSPHKTLPHPYEFLGIPYSHLSGLFLGKLERQFIERYHKLTDRIWQQLRNWKRVAQCSTIHLSTQFLRINDRIRIFWILKVRLWFLAMISQCWSVGLQRVL